MRGQVDEAGSVGLRGLAPALVCHGGGAQVLAVRAPARRCAAPHARAVSPSRPDPKFLLVLLTRGSCGGVCRAPSGPAGRPAAQAAVAAGLRAGAAWRRQGPPGPPQGAHGPAAAAAAGTAAARANATGNATEARLHAARGRGPIPLVVMGGGLGLIHVLTGPDHISAIATLSVGGSYKAFWLGVRWGLGHSIGLLLMFVVFLEFGKRFIAHDGPVGFWADLIVGVFMIGLGGSGCHSAWQFRREGSLIPASDFDISDCEMDSDFLMPGRRDAWEKTAATNGWGHGAAGGGTVAPSCSPKKSMGVAENGINDHEVEVLLQVMHIPFPPPPPPPMHSREYAVSVWRGC